MGSRAGWDDGADMLFGSRNDRGGSNGLSSCYTVMQVSVDEGKEGRTVGRWQGVDVLKRKMRAARKDGEGVWAFLHRRRGRFWNWRCITRYVA